MDTSSTAAIQDIEQIRSWLSGRLPEDWFEAAPSVTVDREEVVVVGRLKPPSSLDNASDAERTAAVRGRATAFRERTRELRIVIAQELEQRFDRKVSWAVEVDGDCVRFTHLAAPVMTRLRQPERQVLDTLVAAGAARSRADALAWCVRLVGQHTNDWLTELREAMTQVEKVRAAGPS